MKIERILYKISGDLIERSDVLDEVKNRAKDPSKLIDLIYGFGTKLSERLKELNIPFEYVNESRVTTVEGLNFAYKVSEEIKKQLKNEFRNMNITLISPVKREQQNVHNINADELVMKMAHKYDKVYVYTQKGRNKDKFKGIKNIEIVYR